MKILRVSILLMPVLFCSADLTANRLNPTDVSEGNTVDLTNSTGSVFGSVVDSLTGLAVRDVLALIRGTDVSAVTDVAGRFTLRGIPAGTHDIVFIKSGYVQSSASGVVVTGKSATRIDFPLPPRGG